MEQRPTRAAERGEHRCAAVVTGAAGFIGAAVCRLLLSRGWRVFAVVRPGSSAPRLPQGHEALRLVYGNLMDAAAWSPALEAAAAAGERFDCWLQLGWEGVAGAARNDDVQAANVGAAVESVRLAARLGCNSWIGAGSQAEYGQMAGRADESAPAEPTTAYGRAKLAAGKQALEEAAKHGLSGYWLRIFSVYGPGDNDSWLIPGLIRQLLAGESPAMTPGEQRWDCLYIDDAASAFAMLAEQSAAGRRKRLADLSPAAADETSPVEAGSPRRKAAPAPGVYNLGSGASLPVRDIAELVRMATAAWLPCRLPPQPGGAAEEAGCAIVSAAAGADCSPPLPEYTADGKRLPMIRYGAVPYRDDQVMLMEAENAKLRRETGWSPSVGLAEGVARTAASFAGIEGRRRAMAVKRSIVTMAYRTNSSHVGAALSVADIMLALYCRVLRVDPEQPAAPGRDKLVFSKAHASTALYAVLAESGFFPHSLLDGYAVNGGRLPGHLDRHSAPGIDASAGSLGHGLSIGAGLALADRLAGRDCSAYVVLGDGECNEGSVWEAALVAASLKLGHLIAVVDCNGWQGFGRTDALSPLSALGDKWRAFGWEAEEVDGHDEAALAEALKRRSPAGAPRAVLARTVKGSGVDYMADTLEWHYKSPNLAQWVAAMVQLGGGEAGG